MTALKSSFSSININLLPNSSDFEKTSWGKFLKWALTVGRYIVIFTELIVISAFLARFKLDKDITDLHESIQQEKNIISSFSSLEKKYRNLQARTITIANLSNNQIDFEKLLREISDFTPIDATFSDITFQNGVLTLTGTSLSGEGLATLLYQYKNSPNYTDVSLDNVSRAKNSLEIQFLINCTLAKDKFKKI